MFRFQVLAVILREFLINTCFSIVDLDVKIVQCIEGGCRNGECDKLTGEVELKLGIWYIGAIERNCAIWCFSKRLRAYSKH